MAVGHAQVVVENHEAELEANPVFNSDYERVVFQWLRDCKFGREFSAWSEYLPQNTVDTIGQLIREKAARMYGRGAKVYAPCIEAAYIALLDEGKLEAFENEAAKIKKQREAESVKNAERDRLAGELHDASEAGYERAMSAYESEEDLKRLQGDKKLASSKKGMAELRRRALFGSNENAFPISTGTAKRV